MSEPLHAQSAHSGIIVYKKFLQLIVFFFCKVLLYSSRVAVLVNHGELQQVALDNCWVVSVNIEYVLVEARHLKRTLKSCERLC